MPLSVLCYSKYFASQYNSWRENPGANADFWKGGLRVSDVDHVAEGHGKEGVGIKCGCPNQLQLKYRSVYI